MKNLIKKIILESLLFEDIKHVKQLFTNWANKKSGNPELALSLMDDFLKHQKKLKRDFTSFSSAEEMKQALDKVRQSEVEKQKLSDAVKIFENNEVLVVAANTHEASCRYAAGTKWCTGAADTDEYWKRHNRTGTEFIWIFKTLTRDDPNYKFSFHIKWNRLPDWCNAVNRCSTKTPLILTAQSSAQFPQYFDYKEVLKKCFEYHEERRKNLGIGSKKPSGGLLEKFIERVRRIIVEEINWQFDDAVNNSFEDYYAGEEYEEEYMDFVYGKKEEIIEATKNLIEDDISTITEEDLTNDYEDFLLDNPNFTEEDFITYKVEDYLTYSLTEILIEEIGLVADEFLREKDLN
jgi:hypothetical protein